MGVGICLELNYLMELPGMVVALLPQSTWEGGRKGNVIKQLFLSERVSKGARAGEGSSLEVKRANSTLPTMKLLHTLPTHVNGKSVSRGCPVKSCSSSHIHRALHHTTEPLLGARRCSTHFSLIVPFNPQKTLLGRQFYDPYGTDKETEACRG